jgi:Tol biopolymer transport system component
MGRTLRLVSVISLALAACTTPERTVTTRPPVSPEAPASDASVEPSPLRGPPASAGDLPGRLLVQTTTAGLGVIRPDGTEPTELVRGEPNAREVLTAVWSPDGARIAWSQVDVRDGPPANRVVTSDARGEDRSEARLPFGAFYLSWDPTSSRVAFLGGQTPFTLGVMERSPGEGGGQPLANGAPFYFSWAPDGRRMVTHVASANLDTVKVNGDSLPLERATGPFQAPVWTADGRTLLYAADDALVARDVASGRVRTLAPLDGFGLMVASADGRVAFHARGPGEVDFYDRDIAERATDLGVRVVDVDGGPETVVTRAPAVAWSWSPDGRRLAILEPVYGEDAIRFRWVIWDGRDSFATDPFVATLYSQQRQWPFFTQFAQSTSMWSPDGSAFAFAAEQPDGTPTIWVQQAREGVPAFPVALGVAVAWSPTA